ncbi:MAG: lipocalin family protein [Vicinamibacterales bacterium]
MSALIGAPMLIAALVAASRARETAPLDVVPELDLQRYTGLWYEIARLPNEFQTQCVSDVTASYSLRDDGRLDVVNRCRRADGTVDEASGVARRVDGRPPSVLEVRFAPAFLSPLPSVWGDYRVIALSPDYDWSLVGTPDRKNLWILSRDRTLDDATMEMLRAEAAAQGFPVAQLMRTSQRGTPVH